MNVSANLFTAKYKNPKCFNKKISSCRNQFASTSSLKKDNYNLTNEDYHIETHKNKAPKIKHECGEIEQSPPKNSQTEFMSTPLNNFCINEENLALITPNVSLNQSYPEVTPLRTNTIEKGPCKVQLEDDKTDTSSNVRRSLVTEMWNPNEAIPTSINSQTKRMDSILISPTSLSGPKIDINSNIQNNDALSLKKIKIEDQHSPIRSKEKKCNPSDKEIKKQEHDLNNKITKKEKSFPEIIYDMVSETAEKNPEILTWIENGEAFIVHDTVSNNSNKSYFFSYDPTT